MNEARGKGARRADYVFLSARGAQRDCGQGGTMRKKLSQLSSSSVSFSLIWILTLKKFGGLHQRDHS
ncbi:hypothetical protein ACFX13_037871 [Malus domestica]